MTEPAAAPDNDDERDPAETGPGQPAAVDYRADPTREVIDLARVGLDVLAELPLADLPQLVSVQARWTYQTRPTTPPDGPGSRSVFELDALISAGSSAVEVAAAIAAWARALEPVADVLEVRAHRSDDHVVSRYATRIAVLAELRDRGVLLVLWDYARGPELAQRLEIPDGPAVELHKAHLIPVEALEAVGAEPAEASPSCPRCYRDLVHDGDGWNCYDCHVAWSSDGGSPHFAVDYGDLS